RRARPASKRTARVPNRPAGHRQDPADLTHGVHPMTDTVTFVNPPLGLGAHTDFELGHVAGSDSLFSLQSLADENLRLFVVNPGDIIPDYEPVISGAQAQQLGIADAEDAVLFVIARMADDGLGVNLLAPIVVNRHT